MRLSVFILERLESILQEWEDFARSIWPSQQSTDVAELRDHAKEILEDIAATLAGTALTIDTEGGAQPVSTDERAAHTHAETRLKSGFNIDQLVSEYCALRASVLRLWLETNTTVTRLDMEDMSRFNEALDQALAESIARYSSKIRRSQDIFLGIVGHDLRTPLQCLSIGAEFLMRSEKSDTQLIQLGSRMYDSASRMNQILDNLLDFTRSRTGSGMRIKPRPIDLAMVSEQVADEFRFSHPGRAIHTLVLGDVFGHWDGARIGQVYQNLVGNALQHGARDQDVTVRTYDDTNGVRIDVHNHGEPIPPAVQANIFDPLHRYASLDAEQGEHLNLGLGLFIVREIVAAHRGTIEVISDAATGTTFSVRLPKGPGPT